MTSDESRYLPPSTLDELRERKPSRVYVMWALDLALASVQHEGTFDVYITGDMDGDWSDVEIRPGDGGEVARKSIGAEFMQFCKDSGIQPRRIYNPLLRDMTDPAQGALYFITFDECEQWIAAYCVAHGQADPRQQELPIEAVPQPARQTSPHIDAEVGEQETTAARRKRRHDAVAKMAKETQQAMPTTDYESMPRGVTALAKAEGIKRQSYTEDVKAHIRSISKQGG